jgi:nucleoside-diphosphate-sugar epimerase
VLVTGGAGFLGSHLVEALVSKGATVYALDYVDNPDRLKDVTKDITYVQADITEWDGEAAGQRSFDVVFHLAGFSAPAAAQRQAARAFHLNVMGTANMLQIAQRCGARKFVFTSAAAIYTNVPKYLPIDEKHPIDPNQSVYATTKRVGELLCEEFHRNYGLPTLYFRLFNTFGTRQSTEYLVPSFIQQAHAEGRITVRNENVRRDFNYVDDVVDALLRGGESGYCGGPINIGTGVEHSVGEIARKIGSLMGVGVQPLNQEVFGPMRQLCDNGLAKRILDWRPVRSLDEGLEITVQWFLSESDFGGIRPN